MFEEPVLNLKFSFRGIEIMKNRRIAWPFPICQVLTMLALGWVVTVVPFQVGLMEPNWGTLLLGPKDGVNRGDAKLGDVRFLL